MRVVIVVVVVVMVGTRAGLWSVEGPSVRGGVVGRWGGGGEREEGGEDGSLHGDGWKWVEGVSVLK